MSDLAAFLLARIGEDEAAAKAALDVLSAGDLDDLRYEWGDRVPVRVAGHIARHDPARVLREAAAKRKIIERYEYAKRHEAPGNPDPDEYEWHVLSALAEVWSDHPDYREEWRP